MQSNRAYMKPSERELTRLTAHLNNAPPLVDDSESDRCLVGFFGVDGELTSVRLQSIDELDDDSGPGIAVPITSRTDSIADLERRWNQSLLDRRH